VSTARNGVNKEIRMVQQKKVIIDIDEKGNCLVEGKNFIGPECSHFIEEIEESLGERISQTDKPEYCQRAIVRDRNMQRGGR